MVKRLRAKVLVRGEYEPFFKLLQDNDPHPKFIISTDKEFSKDYLALFKHLNITEFLLGDLS